MHCIGKARQRATFGILRGAWPPWPPKSTYVVMGGVMCTVTGGWRTSEVNAERRSVTRTWNSLNWGNSWLPLTLRLTKLPHRSACDPSLSLSLSLSHCLSVCLSVSQLTAGGTCMCGLALLQGADTLSKRRKLRSRNLHLRFCEALRQSALRICNIFPQTFDSGSLRSMALN